MDVEIIDGEFCAPYEYFCRSCQQCRLSFVVEDNCAHCGGEIVKGAPWELDLDALRGGK
jgi:hypothetical protein